MGQGVVGWVDGQGSRFRRRRTSEEQRRLTTQGLERKQQLLDRAAELFAERGYAETRVIDIVRAAGVAKGLFYWYFDNKEALFRELVELNRQRLRVAQAHAMDPTAEPLLRIRQGAEASMAFMSSQAHFFALLEVENLEKQFADVLRRGTEVHAADVAGLVRAGIDDGSIRDEDPMLLAYGVVGAVGYYGHFHRTGRVSLPVAELGAFVGRFVVCSLAADESIARRVLAVGVQRSPASAPVARRSPIRSARSVQTHGAPGPTPVRVRPSREDRTLECVVPQFLSDEWMTEAMKIREENSGGGGGGAHSVRMNMIIIECPEGIGTDGSVDAYMDTSGGSLEMDKGHLENPELTVTVDYATAKAIFVDQNPQAGMQAFMAGKIKVQGDMTKLMAMQQGSPDPAQAVIAAKIKEITD